MSHADGLLFDADEIRNLLIRGRMLGLPRASVFEALTLRLDELPLTRTQVRRIFDEEWPSELGSGHNLSEMCTCFFRLSSPTRTYAVLRGLDATAGVQATRMPQYVNVIRVEYPFGQPPDNVVHRFDPYAQFERALSPDKATGRLPGGRSAHRPTRSPRNS
jgi:hypothetical protein